MEPEGRRSMGGPVNASGGAGTEPEAGGAGSSARGGADHTQSWIHFLRRARGERLWSILVPLVLVWVGLAFVSPYFLTRGNIVNLLLNAAPLALIAAGMTLALVAAEIDLSVGSVASLVGAFSAYLMKIVGVPWPIAAMGGLALGTLIGVINSWFVIRVGMPSFVATLAMMGIARGAALILTQGQAIYGLPAGFTWLGQGWIGPLPFPIVLMVLIYLVLHFVATRTVFGLNLYASGGNLEAARLAGVRVSRVKVGVLVLTSLMASIAGMVLAGRLDAGSGVIGEDLLLDSIAAVVIGGTSLLGGVGTVPGTLIGTLLIASIRNGLVLLNVQAFWQLVVIGLLILTAVSLDHFAKTKSR